MPLSSTAAWASRANISSDGSTARRRPAGRHSAPSSIGAHCFKTGYFVAPGKLETFARTSFVTGPFGGGNEFGGGVNSYVKGSRDWRIDLLGPPNQPFAGTEHPDRITAGESGTLFQLQWFTDF